MSPIPFQEHPYREAVLEEVHARPIELIEGRTRVRRLAFAFPTSPEAPARIVEAFLGWCGAVGVAKPGEGMRQHSYRVGERQVTWELHTEFVTFTWRSGLDDKDNWPEGIGLESVGEAQLVCAVRVDVIEDLTVPDRIIEGFECPSLCLVDVEGGAGQVATDFIPDADSYTRLELASGGMNTLRRSIIVRRLLEIETYRTMALLGLPLARQISPQLRAAEAGLTEAVEAMPETISTDRAQASLAALHALSVRSGQLSDRTGYRFAACNAYGDILNARLDGLHERQTGRGSTLSRYIGSRVDPALATYAAIEKRQRMLNEKIERAIGLLDVRIGLDVQIQNRNVLEAIAQTARSQFLLQRTVEGLSVIAISYYLLGILSYLFAGPLEVLHVSKTMALSLAAPLVVLVVWLIARSVRRTHPPA
ncbi:DUF3422 family protein [Arsenicitalea aurantiaca]|uniref:DUF3422 family protein n=1 Tax=Arsenicitalea aurantiaca TaxID=1783274 RepID=A0A433XER9_9HYPH|nr:DUF3422 domain-containing protein [Arsenicitalea aurantiaca]RUT32595.1 DUF3422 family protein [Arsenicitalea aurantiaca]